MVNAGISFETTASGLNPSDFNTVINGKEVRLYVLKNKGGQSYVLQILEVS